MNELKQSYNKLLTRFNKACIYINADERTPTEIEKWTPEFNRLCREMSELINKMESQGMEFTDEELIGGFKDEG